MQNQSAVIDPEAAETGSTRGKYGLYQRPSIWKIHRLTHFPNWIVKTYHIAGTALMAQLLEISNDEPKARILSGLNAIIDESEALELKFTAMFAKRLVLDLQKLPQHDISDKLRILRDRLADEIDMIEVFVVRESMFRYYREPDLFGKQVSDSFPSAAYDISEAGKCLALDRGTACVFHLMRVMETALREVASALSIQECHEWGRYLNAIRDKVVAMKKSDPQWFKANGGFYNEVQAHLSAVKLTWRNPTMHVVNRYGEESAKDIFESVRMFMAHVATRISEK